MREPLEDGHELGDSLALVFQLVLQYLDEKGYLSRCNRPNGPPKAATDPRKFHHLHYRSFGSEHRSWPTLAEPDQRRALRSYLFRQWTTDPQARVVRPRPPARVVLCKASWAEFWMTDEELNDLVSWSVSHYQRGAADLFA